MAPTSILVLGAGELGGAVLRSLAKHPSRANTRLAVLLRSSTINSKDDSKQKTITDLKDLGIELVTGDLVEQSMPRLEEIFQPFDTVINCSGMSAPPGTRMIVATAAIASGCREYFPWQFGIDYDTIGRNSAQSLFSEQLDVRDLLRSQSHMEWTVISTGMFTSFIFEPAFGIVSAERDSVTALGSWENSITTTTAEDIGKIVAEVVLSHPQTNGVLFSAGDTVSMQQIADVVDKVMRRKVQRSVKSVAQLLKELEDAPHDGMKKYRVLFAQGVGTLQHPRSYCR